jgi:spore coat protein A
MSLTRRDWLGLTGVGLAGVGLVTGSCSLGARPEPRLLSSQADLPRPFQVALPRPAVLAPVRTGEDADYYEITVREASQGILPGLTTRVWGYNGTFPGPTIEARSGRKAVVRLRNTLPVPIVNHLHGGRTPPESDGFPTDLVRDTREYTYPNRQRAATLWYHDHRMDFTAPQVWRGLAGFYIIRDEEERRLPLPSGEKEIPLVICDRSFARDGAFLYPSIDSSLQGAPGVTHEYMGGVLGDVVLVNGAPWPVLEVANTKYRFRILNASNARRYELTLDPAPAGGHGLVQIGSDGGLLAEPVTHRSLPISPAERFDVAIDFSRYALGTKITLANAEGQGPAAQVLQFHVTRREQDLSRIPARLSQVSAPDPSAATVTRQFDFSYNRGLMNWTVNGKPYDPKRIDAWPKLGATEIWQFTSDFSHPLHLHLVHFQVLSHSGRPTPWDGGYKDTVALRAGETAGILVKFTGYRGKYVFHCHNLEHEDMAMMANFEVV